MDDYSVDPMVGYVDTCDTIQLYAKYQSDLILRLSIIDQ